MNIQRYPNGSRAVPRWFQPVRAGMESYPFCCFQMESYLFSCVHMELYLFYCYHIWQNHPLIQVTLCLLLVAILFPLCFHRYITVFFRTRKMDWRKLDKALVQINTWSIVLHPQKIQMEGRTWMTEALQLLVNFILLISFLFVDAQNKKNCFHLVF